MALILLVACAVTAGGREVRGCVTRGDHILCGGRMNVLEAADTCAALDAVLLDATPAEASDVASMARLAGWDRWWVAWGEQGSCTAMDQQGRTSAIDCDTELPVVCETPGSG